MHWSKKVMHLLFLHNIYINTYRITETGDLVRLVKILFGVHNLVNIHPESRAARLIILRSLFSTVGQILFSHFFHGATAYVYMLLDNMISLVKTSYSIRLLNS